MLLKGYEELESRVLQHKDAKVIECRVVKTKEGKVKVKVRTPRHLYVMIFDDEKKAEEVLNKIKERSGCENVRQF